MKKTAIQNRQLEETMQRISWQLCLFQTIKLLLQTQWSVTIQHIYREANRATDFMAGLARSYPLGIHILHDIPPTLRCIIGDDCMGITFLGTIPA